MGMAASQARFLQLTARRSNVEYQAQQINFERLQLSQQLNDASTLYNDKMSNTVLQFSYSNSNGKETVPITYKNYKNFMNKQLEGLNSSQQQYFLVSSSGNKLIVGSEEEMYEMMNANMLPPTVDKDGNSQEQSRFSINDFIIVESDDLNDEDKFQQALKDGIYYFATLNTDDSKADAKMFNVSDIDTMSSVSEVLDTSDDKQAEAEYDSITSAIQRKDKKMEMELNQLETERNAIQTEIDSVSKVIEDNTEKSYKTFSG